MLAGKAGGPDYLDFAMSDPMVRSGRVRIRKRRRLSRTLWCIIIAATLGWGLFLADIIYHETVVSDERAVADCIEEHNRDAAGSSGQDAVAVAAMCAHSKSTGQ